MAKRLALITGGMGGLGATITSKMVEAGYEVVVTASPQNVQTEAWLAEMKTRGCEVRAVPVDVADYDSCERCVAQCRTISARSISSSTTPASQETIRSKR